MRTATRRVAGIVVTEFERSIRSYALLVLSVLFVCFAGGLAAIQWVPIMFRDSHVPTSTLAMLNRMRQPTVLLVPAIGIALGYGAIVGAVERGSIKLVLGLPVGRGSVVLGTVLGRTAVVSTAILVGYGVVGLIALGFYATFDAAAFLAYTLLTICYGTTYVSIAVGFSAFARSRSRALFGAIVLYAIFLAF
ncbi:ABC-2 type transporter [Salinarchaeum sp. Harcht-Bsk1]|nr:ABC-2 type transporter [Salinarchaeum sp. Harcht-Bsk1]